MSRYQIKPGSQSGHCCFDFTVIDTTKPVIFNPEQGQHIDRYGEPMFESVCECFEQEGATLICAALNAQDGKLA